MTAVLGEMSKTKVCFENVQESGSSRSPWSILEQRTGHSGFRLSS